MAFDSPPDESAAALEASVAETIEVEEAAALERRLQEQRRQHPEAGAALALPSRLRGQCLPDRVGDETRVDDGPDREGGTCGREEGRISAQSPTRYLGDGRASRGAGAHERPDDRRHRSGDDEGLADAVGRHGPRGGERAHAVHGSPETDDSQGMAAQRGATATTIVDPVSSSTSTVASSTSTART